MRFISLRIDKICTVSGSRFETMLKIILFAWRMSSRSKLRVQKLPIGFNAFLARSKHNALVAKHGIMAALE